MSRREMIAWLAAATGAATTGSVLLLDRPRSEPLGGAANGGRRATTPASAPGTAAAPQAVGVDPTADTSDRLLVVVELSGGNDGLSTAVPYGSGAYYDLRDHTAIAEADVLDLDGSIGLHPNLVGLHERGVGIVEGIGSMQPDGSHFEMQQRWWAGDSDLADTTTGWIGRLADTLRPGGDTTTAATALSVARGAHPIIRSATGSTISMPGTDALGAVAGAIEDDDRMRWVYQRALRQFAAGATPVSTAMSDGIAFADQMVALGLDDESATELGYDEWGFGASLQFAAAVFDGGVGVRVVHVETEGDYDTHEGHAYRHPELMRELDTNISAFHRDLERRGLGDRVMVMTTSEFGRTALENASGGLDHGTASTMLLSGPGASGRLGEAPSLTRRDDNDDLVATAPFEAYLGGVVEGWMGVPSSEIFDPSIAPMPLF